MSTALRSRRTGGGQPSTRWDMAAIAIINLINGAMFGSWYPWVPTIAHNLALSPLHLAWALFGLPAGLATGAISSRWLIKWFGLRRVLGVGILLYAGGMALPGLVHAPFAVGAGVTLALPITLGFALGLPGTGNGWVDQSTQNLTNRAEAITGRLLQPRLQMWLTLGAVVASVFAPIAIRRHATPRDYLTAVAAIGLLLGLVACVLLIKGHLADPGANRRQTPQYRAGGFVRPAWLIAVCAIAVAGFMGEGVFGDWGGQFAHVETATTLQNAAWTYTTFALSEMVIRFLTERVVLRIGEHRVALIAGVVTMLGALAFISAHDLTQALVGAGLLGAGIAPIVPMAFSVVGENTVAQVWVNLAGYLGVSAGPPLIGLFIQLLGWRFALGALVPLAVVTIVLAGVLRPRLPIVELRSRYGSSLGKASARLRVIEDAAKRAEERASQVDEVRQPTKVRVNVEGGRIVVLPETASALRRRRRILAMLSYYEVEGHIVALEWVVAGNGPRRFVVWEVSNSVRTAQKFDAVEPAVAAFRAALEPDWNSTWNRDIDAQLAAARAQIVDLERLPGRAALLMQYTEDAQQQVVIRCPEAADLERRRARRATAWAIPLPDGALLAVQRVRVSRGASAQLALFDSAQGGRDVHPFEGSVAEEIGKRFTKFRQPSWLAPPEISIR